MDANNFTLGSLFDGIGGFPYAASFYGIRTLWASEIMPECISITKRHFPDMVHLGDITRLHGGQLPPVDIITFGSPCQGWSICGRRQGMADERSGLFMEAIRIIDEMKEATHGRNPQFTVWENVPHTLAALGGCDYQVVLQAFTKGEVPMPRSGKWANAGMVRSRSVDLAWCIYDSQHFGLAQRRKRLFLICDLGGRCAGEILFVPQSLYRRTASGAAPWEKAAAPPGAGSDAAKRRLLVHPPVVGTLCASGAGLSRPAGMGSESDLCIVSAGFRYKAGSKAGNIGYQMEMAPTLIAGQPSGVLTAAVMGDPENWELTVRRLTPLEAERAMGLEDSWTEYGHDGRKISDTKRYEMLGNSLAINCVAYIMQGICQALERRNQS